jgi:hypothetical protein
VFALPLFLHRLPLFLWGVPLTLLAKRRSHRQSASSVIMLHRHSNHFNNVKTDEARRRGRHGRSKGHATDSACTRVHRLYRRQHTLTHTRSPSRQGAVYTDTYIEPIEARRRLHRCLQEPPRGRAPSTLTSTRTPSQGGMAFTSSLLRHPHQHH